MSLDDVVAGLRCRDVLTLLGDYVDGGLADATRDQVAAHVAGCGNCAAFGGAYGAIATALRRPATDDAEPPGLAERLAARLDEPG